MTRNDTKQIADGGWGRQMLAGSIWMIASRWAIRLSGVISTIILARLLAPKDFGIVAMAMIVVGMLEILSQTGQKLALIRLEKIEPEHYDAAWTGSLLVGLGIASLIFAVAPLSVSYFHEPQAIAVMYCLAFRAVLAGAESIGIVDIRRDLQFDRYFILNVLPKLLSVIITVVLAIVLRSYWALVVGILANQILRTVLSYVLKPVLPRLSLKRIGDIWAFSVWSFARALGAYLNTQIGLIAVGGVAGASALGRFSVAADVATSPSREISEPLVAVLYPVMARWQGNVAELKSMYLRTLGWSALICFSTGAGVALVAFDMVHLLLGPKWHDIVPLIPWLALSGTAVGLSTGAYTLFDAIGRPRIGARMIWLRLLILALVMFPIAWQTHDIYAIAVVQFVGNVLFLPGLFAAVGKAIDIHYTDYIAVLWRPSLSASAMASAIITVHSVVPFSGVLRLLLDCTLGASIFLGVSLTLWASCGRPDAPEKDLLHICREQLNAVTRRLEFSKKS